MGKGGCLGFQSIVQQKCEFPKFGAFTEDDSDKEFVFDREENSARKKKREICLLLLEFCTFTRIFCLFSTMF